MLEELLEQMELDDNPRETLTDFQVIERLKDIHAQRQDVTQFCPGDIIQHKYPSMADTKAAANPEVFIKYIDILDARHFCSEIRDLGSSIATKHFDCVIGCIIGGNYSQHFAQSCEYKLRHEN